MLITEHRPLLSMSRRTLSEHWAELFLEAARTSGLQATALNYSQGWLETALIEGQLCFVRSMTYNRSSRQYFGGVDPEKLRSTGDLVLLCGGVDDALADIYIVPWGIFFGAIAKGEPVNTYKAPKKYMQYKFHVHDRDYSWVISIQGGSGPRIHADQYKLRVVAAIQYFADRRASAGGA